MSALSLLRNSSLLKIVFFGDCIFSCSLSSMNPFSQENINSFRSSQLDVVFRCVSPFIVAASVRFEQFLESFCSLTTLSECTCCLCIGLVSLLSSPFLTIFRFSRDWSILRISCGAVSADHFRCLMSFLVQLRHSSARFTMSLCIYHMVYVQGMLST